MGQGFLFRGGSFGSRISMVERDAQEKGKGLVLKAHRVLYHSTLGSRVIKKKRKRGGVRTVLDKRDRRKCVHLRMR